MLKNFNPSSKKQKIIQKCFSWFSIFSLVLQVGSGAFLYSPAFAQETQPTPTVEASPTPTDVVNPTPTEPTPTPILTETITPTEVPVKTPTPTAEITPTVEVTPTTETTPTVEATPTTEATPTVTATPTTESSPTTTPTPEVLGTTAVEETIQVVIVPSLLTDKLDYAPTDVAEITGQGFLAFTTYTLLITADNLSQTFSVTTDISGSFKYDYQLDGVYRPLYKVEAKDSSGNIVATTTFTDAAPLPSPDPAKFAQCANKNPTAGACDWIGSILHSANSVYFEGMSVPQRIFDGGFGNGAHTIAFSYSYTKGGIHAYDFITGKNQGNGSFTPGITTFNDCQGLTGANLTSCTALITTTTERFVSIPNDSFDSKDSAPAPGTGSTQTAKETAYGARNISVYNQGTISGMSISPITHSVAAEGDTGDSDATLTFNFTLADCPSGPGDPGCDILIYFDGHLAVGGSDNATGVNWGPGLGSSNISGGPYHIKDVNLDGGGGSLDNQIQGASILVPNNASITIIKDAVPNDPQDFSFTTTGSGLSSFSLDDDGDVTLSNTEVFSGLAPSTYSVAEGAATNWTSDGGVCSDGSPVSAIVLSASENVTCTFTNTLQTGHIIVDKVTNPFADPQSFTFITTGSGYSGFSLTDIATPNDQTLNAGTYSVSETVPSGWDLTSATCVSSILDTETIAGLELDPNETITCTFTNTKRSHIIVDKVTDPSGSPQSFDFTTTGSGYSGFSLTDAAAPNDQEVVPGAYSVAETVPAGWDLTSATCDQGETPASLDVGPGETVTCTFNNQKDANIIVVKQTDPDGSQVSFEFDSNYGSNFFLTDGQSNDSGDLDPGTYSVLELVPTGWDLTSVTCSDDSISSSIDLSAGETVTCTFNDQADANIIVEKQTNPDGDSQLFDFNVSWDAGGAPDFQLADNGSNNSGDLNPGTYSVSETVPAGWDMTGVTCSDGSPIGSISLQAGETVTCTFNNEKDAFIIIEKQTLPDGSPQVFDFDMDYGDGDADLSDGQQDNSGDLAPGTYSVSENTPAGWDLTSVTCDDQSDPSSISLQAGETVTCVFTNTQRAHIFVVKDVIGNPDPTDFTFHNDFGNGNDPTFLLDEDTNDALPSFRDFEVLPGTYAVSEDLVIDWQSPESTSCTNDETVGSIDVAPGETVTCTFVNEELVEIILIKNTIGGDAAFDFDATGAGLPTDIDLTTVGGTATKTFTGLDQDNTYSIAENVPDGWDLTSATCDKGETPDDIDIEPGETVTCTFENTKRGHITIEKQTIPNGDPAEFTFTGDIAGVLSDGDTATEEVAPGTYHSTESVLSGWALADIICTDSDSSGATGTGIATFNVAAGEDVTCTFTNNKPAAQIDVTPLSAFNKVGNDHVITATVQVHNGNGSYVDAPDGTLVTFSLSNNTANASFVGGNTCTTTAGDCSVTINSTQTGGVDVHASSDPVELGVAIHVETDGIGDNSANTHKTYVNAKISIGPSADTNEVNNDHDFVVTVEQDTGSGFVPVPEGTLADAIASPVPDGGLDVSDCNDGVDALGQCTVVINSSVAGVFTITARSTVSVNGVEFKLQTNGVGDNSGPATKTYVDASIALSPQESTNDVNDEHEITATVTQNDGGGVDPAVGVTVVFTITSGTADFVGGDDDCVTNGSGQCSVSIFDDTPGANIIDATSTFSVGGVSLTRATDGNSGPDGSDAAEKTYIGGKIIVQKVTVGGDGSFNFNTDYSTDFQLSNGGSNDSGYIPTGSHSVSEDVPAGWDLTSATCTGDDDGIDPASIQLDDGEEVTCTFTNTKRGTITIVKDAQPNDCQDFAFTFTGKPDFSLDDNAGVADCTDTDRNQSQTFNNLPADNDYTAAETLPNAFWEFGGATCVNTGGSTPYTHTAAATNGITVTLDPGANVTCTFVNNKLGPTRTLGFWQTHTAYTTSQFAAHPFTIGDNSTHKGPIDISKVFGGFYAPISKTTSGSKRSAVDQARIQLLQQLLAAKLNCGTFGCSASIHTLITGADAAYVAGNKTAILNYASLLDAYNNSGDTIIIGNAGNATPKTSQGLADKAFWNAP